MPTGPVPTPGSLSGLFLTGGCLEEFGDIHCVAPWLRITAPDPLLDRRWGGDCLDISPKSARNRNPLVGAVQ